MKYIPYLYNKNKTRYINLITTKIGYSSSSLPLSSLASSLPVAIKVFYKLDDNDTILSYRQLLKDKAGIYCFVNTVTNKRYIGSAKDLYIRLIEHLSNKKSNIALQNAISKI